MVDEVRRRVFRLDGEVDALPNLLLNSVAKSEPKTTSPLLFTSRPCASWSLNAL